jgi:hypothetical protein
MYESLCKVCDNFHLYVFAFDDATFQYFTQKKLTNLTVISLKEFEDEELLRIKATRTAGEYCWTCTSSTILYCLEKHQLDHCTYIDADMIFYSNPRVINEEAANASVLITEHRYTPAYDQSATSGIYCVQYVLFKNDERGLKALRWWRDACIEWCYNRHENGKFGDQKYLDDWTIRFEGVHVLQQEGGGVAPWNLQQYQLSESNGTLYVQGRTTTSKVPLIFFHFHGLRFYNPDLVEYSGAGYSIPQIWKTKLFTPYAKKLFAIGDSVTHDFPAISNPNASGPGDYTTRGKQSLDVFKANVVNYLRFLVGRIKQFRKLENHLYRRGEL